MDSRNPRDVHAVVPQKGDSEPDQTLIGQLLIYESGRAPSD